MNGIYLQRRYLFSFDARRLPHIFTDVLVVGAGIAGLRAAIEAQKYGQVIVLTKGRLDESNSYLAQGGLAAAIGDEDSVESHISDTLATGGGLCDDEVVRYVIARAPEHVEQIRRWGVKFDTEAGRFQLAREGGHSTSRIVHANGDATGQALSDVLGERVKSTPRIKIFEECFAVDLLTDPVEGGEGATCVGVLSVHPRYGLQVIRARQTILAAGGSGMIWRETSNPPNATADAIAMAFRAGVVLSDLEMMQFHPTTLYIAGGTRSLISEAVRGEGAYLLDRSGERFMKDYHEMGELAPRDVVSRAILKQMAKTHATHVFLDVRHLGARFAERFPRINQKARSFGIDPSADLIPVHPAAHYMIGGAKVDMDGHTSLGGLLGCGEAACTGLHGANRLASNSLTEALVLSWRTGRTAGEALSEIDDKLTAREVDWTFARKPRTELDLVDIRNSLRSLMWRNVGIVRGGERLSETLEIINFWGRYCLDKEFFDPVGWEIQNMLTVGCLVTKFAAARTETRGVHYREDFPESASTWERHLLARRTQEQLILE